MSDNKKAPDNSLDFTIDGETIHGRPGQTILEAGMKAGVFIPHYCWHPALSIAGNCRMCLVHMKGAPKPIIACQTTVREGMEIEAFTAEANKTREGVMEFLLINHPLDCPVCDQAGECDLQEYSFDHGRGESRFQEPKSQKPNKDLGELVRFYGNRCILCSRCVRFCDEITETSELTIRERGDHNFIDTFPGFPLDNPLSLCTTDLCPVGALLDRDFVHKTRVWNLTPTNTICAGCSSGCNSMAQTWDNKVQRLVPRENQSVNKFWMCDRGRLLYHDTVSVEQRVLDYTILAETLKDPEGETIIRAASSVNSAIETLAEKIQAARDKHQGRGLGFILTGWNTNEEIYLALSLLKNAKTPKLGAESEHLATVFAPYGLSWRATDGFKISADKNPNRSGLRRLLGKTYAKAMNAGLDNLKSAINKGKIEALIILNALPPHEFVLPPSFQDCLGKVPFLAVFEQQKQSDFIDKAHLRLPAATFLEKDGTFVNDAGRIQRLRPTSMPEGELRWDLDVLQEVALKLGTVDRVVSSASVFRRIAKLESSPFANLSYNKIGDLGFNLEDKADIEQTGYGAGTVSRHRYAKTSVPEMIRVSVHRGG